MKKELLLAALGSIAVAADTEMMTHEDLDNLLAELAKVPDDLTQKPDIMAMCYDIAMPPDRVEYICPKCGEKTLHINNAAETASLKVENYRFLARQLTESGLDTKLDERFLCVFCCNEPGKDAKLTDFYIEITIDGKTTRSKVDPDDFSRLSSLLFGMEFWETSEGESKPLKPELPRIKELLGRDDVKNPVKQKPDENPVEKPDGTNTADAVHGATHNAGTTEAGLKTNE